MKNLNEIIEKLEDLGFEIEKWENLDRETVYDLIKEEKQSMLYPSFFTYDYFNLNLNSIPEKFIKLEKVISFDSFDLEFNNFSEYESFIDKVLNIINQIETNISFVVLENKNSDFHYISFIFPIS